MPVVAEKAVMMARAAKDVGAPVGAEKAMPTRRRDQAQWRREQIIDAAMTVFGGKGIDAASMKDVAAAAGVTPGLLYHYFASKETLLLAVVAERGFLPELRLLLSTAAGQPATVVVPEILNGFQRILAERAPLVGLLLSGAATNPKIKVGFEEIVTECQRLLGDYLTERVAAGELLPHNAGDVAHVLFSSCAMSHLVGQPTDPATVTQIVLHGILAGTPRRDGAGDPDGATNDGVQSPA